MQEATLAERLRYWFDNTISRGTIALIGWLFVLILASVFAGSLLVYVTGIAPEVGGHRPGFLQTVWLDLMRTIDPGNVGGDRGSWAYLFSMLTVTMGGVFVFSALIGVVSQGIDGKLVELRKGRSFVVERGHTVIFGWSPQIFSILTELAAANESRPDACIAILAQKDKIEMEDEIRARIGRTGKTRIVCRTGDPTDVDDVRIVNPNDARSIIVLPEGEDADSQAIKTILSLVNNPNRREEPYHIVSRIREPGNLSVARMVGRDEVELVPVDNLIARIIAQTCRQSGLSVVYTDLLDFGGDEVYFVDEPRLTGRTFGEALFAYESSSVIGLRKEDGSIALNPPMDTGISAGDSIILVSADDSTVEFSGDAAPEIDAGAIRTFWRREQDPERTLILGWNGRAPTIISQLDGYVSPGSEVTVVSHVGGPTGLDGLRNQTVDFRTGNTTDRKLLDGLKVARYDHVIVLGYSDELDDQGADSRTLMTLLHLREIADRTGCQYSLVSEMLDIRNRGLAEITHADDFVVSDQLVSLAMSQISENKELSTIFGELFGPEGSEVHLKPADEYVKPGVSLDFFTVVEAASRRGEVAIGYRVRAQTDDPSAAYGVRLNPDKSEPLRFAEGDMVIVLSDS